MKRRNLGSDVLRTSLAARIRVNESPAFGSSDIAVGLPPSDAVRLGGREGESHPRQSWGKSEPTTLVSLGIGLAAVGRRLRTGLGRDRATE